jgi:hypothetical protein
MDVDSQPPKPEKKKLSPEHKAHIKTVGKKLSKDIMRLAKLIIQRNF